MPLQACYLLGNRYIEAILQCWERNWSQQAECRLVLIQAAPLPANNASVLIHGPGSKAPAPWCFHYLGRQCGCAWRDWGDWQESWTTVLSPLCLLLSGSLLPHSFWGKDILGYFLTLRLTILFIASLLILAWIFLGGAFRLEYQPLDRKLSACCSVTTWRQ